MGEARQLVHPDRSLRTLEAVPQLLASASIGQSLSSFFDAVGQFFSDLAAVHWGALLLGLLFFGLNLTLRSRAFFHSLRAAYPAVRFKWRRIWGAYFAAVGFNNVVPARGGDVIKLFLTRSPRSRGRAIRRWRRRSSWSRCST